MIPPANPDLILARLGNRFCSLTHGGLLKRRSLASGEAILYRLRYEFGIDFEEDGSAFACGLCWLRAKEWQRGRSLQFPKPLIQIFEQRYNPGDFYGFYHP